MPRLACLSMLLAIGTTAAAAEISIMMNNVDASGVGSALGTVKVVETAYGLVFRPDLKGLSAGLHGFHVHENPSCAPSEKDGKKEPAGAAGPHLDPAGTKKHGEPWGDGHLGDLPALYVAVNGEANQPVLAPRLKLSDVLNRSLMIHMGGDNHADHPAPLGGGGARLACGVIKR